MSRFQGFSLIRKRIQLFVVLLIGTAAIPAYAAYGQHVSIGNRAPSGDLFQEGTQVGKASWYGGRDIGRLTASGERYQRMDITAAHRKLPFNTWVLVTNLRNGKQVVVRINDRGPYVKGRIIDLSFEAAKSIGMVNAGVTQVHLQVL